MASIAELVGEQRIQYRRYLCFGSELSKVLEGIVFHTNTHDQSSIISAYTLQIEEWE